MRRLDRLRRTLVILGVGGTSLSLLFWAKLRLVTQIPRTTYASPDERSEPEDDRARDAEREAETGP